MYITIDTIKKVKKLIIFSFWCNRRKYVRKLIILAWGTRELHSNTLEIFGFHGLHVSLFYNNVCWSCIFMRYTVVKEVTTGIIPTCLTAEIQ